MDSRLASIIILTYNNIEDTHLCLSSIFSKPAGGEFEVIVVDNGSTDGTPAYLMQQTEVYPGLRVKLNPANEGFARGNNIGVGLANGDFIVFLNNDTLVTPGWLGGLLDHLNDPAIGLVGPVTNGANNESRIEVLYQSTEELDGFAAQYTLSHQGVVFDIQALAFMCVAMRRDVFEKVGLLDEQFGLGMFEDDDYANRVREAGCRVVCAEDVFIHHKGGASFDKLDREAYWDLFYENRRKYEKKWKKKWKPHTLRAEFAKEQAVELAGDNFDLLYDLRKARNQVAEQQIVLDQYQEHVASLLETVERLGKFYETRTWWMLERMGNIRRALIPLGSTREKIVLAPIKMVAKLGQPRPQLHVDVPPAEQPAPAPIENKQGTNISVQYDFTDKQVPILAPQFFDFAGENLYIGGAERYLVELTNLIREEGFEPVVYQSGIYTWEREYDGLPVYGIDTEGNQLRLNKLFHERTASHLPVIYLAFYMAAPDCRSRSLGISHGVYWDYDNNLPLEDQAQRLEPVIKPMENLSKIISVDTNTINWVRGVNSTLAEKFTYIPNFVDLDQFKPPQTPRSSDRTVILFPRRLSNRRGFWLVKSMVWRYLETRADVDFLFVGQAEPAESEAMKELLFHYPQRVRWETYALEDMHQAYHQADITLIPTIHSEGTSLSCLEAMASGNAIIATNMGGLPDLIIPNYNGLLIDPTADALYEAIDKLCTDAALRRQMSENGLRVVQSFSIEQWQTKWRTVLKDFLK